MKKNIMLISAASLALLVSIYGFRKAAAARAQGSHCGSCCHSEQATETQVVDAVDAVDAKIEGQDLSKSADLNCQDASEMPAPEAASELPADVK
ncbi:MAG: hypothetical protein NTX86_02645 [Candidatus Dependentiae bacterium]|nr:hypothetical protein [Candidatus Dependentiae bacterium]